MGRALRRATLAGLRSRGGVALQLPWIALAQACGIALADVGLVSVLTALVAAPVLAFAAGLALWRGRGVWLAACGLALCAGALAHASRLEAARLRRPPAPVERTLVGTIDSLVSGPFGYRVDLRDVSRSEATSSALPARVRLYGEPTPSEAPALEQRLPGERVRLLARLRAPSQRRNPGSRSSERTLDRAGIGAVGALVHPALHARLPEREGLRPGAWIAQLRARLRRHLDRAGEGAGLLRALALGDRSAPEAALQEAFARLGLSHLLAVSGLHLALVASLAFGAARFAFGRSAFLAARADARAFALFAAFGAALGYALLAGWGVPVRRSAILLAGVVLAFAGGRRRATLPLLAAAAIVVLARDSGALFQPGAQLSFLASAALVAAARRAVPPTAERSAIALHFAAGLRASASVIALTAPLAAWHFGRAAPFALLLNLVAIPWTAAVLLPAAGVALVAAPLGDRPLAMAVLRITGAVAQRSGEAVLALDRALPVLPAVGPPGGATICVLFALACASLVARHTRSRVALALMVTGLLALAPPRPIAPAPPRLVVLDVGQGDALIVQGRAGAVLVDAGPALRSGFDLGGRIVVPALAALGIRRLDVAVLTHADLDHRGGLPAVLQSLPVGELWLPFGALRDPALGELLAVARRRGVRVRERGAGGATATVGDLALTPLWPPRSAQQRESRNDRSLVLRVEVGARRLLLAGDLEAAAEAALVASGVDLRADLLALPHHGSRTSSSEGFLAAVNASVATVSAPCGGRYPMPHPRVVARAAAHGLPVWWTGRDGALLVGLEGPLVVTTHPSPTLPLPFRCRADAKAGRR